MMSTEINAANSKKVSYGVLKMVDSEVRRRKKKESTTEGPSSQSPTQFTSRLGQLPTFPNQRIWARVVLVICASVIVFFSSARKKESVFASQKDFYDKRVLKLPCSESYQAELSKFKDCVPQFCGRMVSDSLISEKEVETLLNVARTGFALGGSEGGASILDLHSGALSHGQNFVNFYKLPESSNIFKPEEYFTYIMVKNKIQEAVAQYFGINSKLLHLTHPTFFSRLTNAPPKTIHDEYWHKHIDKETYESFHYTTLLYLNDYKKDFSGGRFIFVNADNSTVAVEPKKGRVSIFTSGAENPHYVEKVFSGERFAITISFTCDLSRAITELRPVTPP